MHVIVCVGLIHSFMRADPIKKEKKVSVSHNIMHTCMHATSCACIMYMILSIHIHVILMCTVIPFCYLFFILQPHIAPIPQVS